MLAVAATLCLMAMTAAALTEHITLETLSTAQDSGMTLVIDAGHGGIDGGAVADDGTAEQDINLHIAQTCQSLAGFLGVKTVMTRADTSSLDYDPDSTIRQNKVADIHARERITEEQTSPVFVSIHLNKFSDSSYSGAQTFWSSNNAESRTLAESIQQSLTDGLDQSRTAKKAEDTIYLMKNLDCPAVIVECGFLSNPQEAERLKDDDYHKKLAVCIITGYKNAYD